MPQSTARIYPDDERSPHETGLLDMASVYTLTDYFHIDRQRALTLGFFEGHALLVTLAMGRMGESKAVQHV